MVRVQGLGFRFRVARSVNAASLGQVFGFRVKGLGFRDWGLRMWAWGIGFRVMPRG